MIIAGNSYVSMFRQGHLLSTKSNNKVDIKWVGALQIGHFFKEHPSARKIRHLFSQTDEWKFLSIGTHDKFFLCRALVNNQYTDFFKTLVEQYKTVFLELKTHGKFGWLISPQLLKGNEYMGISEEHTVRTSNDLDQNLSAWCAENGIPVINPLNKILGEDGYPKAEFLQVDNIHLNTLASQCYINEIQNKTGEELIFVPGLRPSDNVLEPRTEPESLALLIAGELGLPWDQTKCPHGTRGEFENKITAFISDRSIRRGMNISPERDTDFINAGKLDSVDLVEIYTYATELFDIELNFDVKLKKLNTVEKLSGFFYKNKPLTRNDFVETLASDIPDKIRSSETLLADSRIAGMQADMYSHFKEIIHLQSPSGKFSYGIVYFWLALAETGKNDYQLSLELLKHAEDAHLPFPFRSSRAEYYRNLWQGRLIESQLNSNQLKKTGKPIMQSDNINSYRPEEKSVNTEDDLLLELETRSKALTLKIEILYIVGSHNLQKCELYFKIFKNLKKIYLFVPVPEIFQKLDESVQHNDSRIEIFPYIFSGTDGNDFLVVNKDSFLNLYKEKQLVSGETVTVECSTIENFVISHNILMPEMLVLNVQGREHPFFSSISPLFLSQIQISYLETNKDDPLNPVKKLLESHFSYVGFAPLSDANEIQGHALFLNKRNIALLADPQQTHPELENPFPENILKKTPNLASQTADSEISAMVESLYQHGENLLKQGGNINDILFAFRMTLHIVPNHSLASYQLAMLFWKYKNINEALKFFNRAFSLDPSNKSIAASFADFCIALGHPQEAKKIYTVCLQQYPDDKEFVQKLSTLNV